MIAQDLEVTLHLAFVEARKARHEDLTLEHLLYALLDNPTSLQDEAGSKLIADYLSSSLFDDVAVGVATSDPSVIAVCNKKQFIANK